MNPNPIFTPYEPTELDRRLEACKPGAYPWDDWERDALAAGVNAHLASLGRSVMREACQHGWCAELLDECGATDTGMASAMIDQAKTQSVWTTARWQWLLVTDGLRSDPWGRDNWPENAPEWRAMHRRYLAESAALEPVEPDAALQIEAGLHIEEFFRLDPLALVDLEDFGIHRHDSGKTILWADFIVLSSSLPRRITHSGVVRIAAFPKESGRNDYTIFEQTEEADHD